MRYSLTGVHWEGFREPSHSKTGFCRMCRSSLSGREWLLRRLPGLAGLLYLEWLALQTPGGCSECWWTTGSCDGDSGIIWGLSFLPFVSKREMIFWFFFSNDVKCYTLNESVSKWKNIQPQTFEIIRYRQTLEILPVGFHTTAVKWFVIKIYYWMVLLSVCAKNCKVCEAQ